MRKALLPVVYKGGTRSQLAVTMGFETFLLPPQAM